MKGRCAIPTIEIPTLPEMAPLGFAVKVSSEYADTDMVIPIETSKAAAKFAKQMQQAAQ